MKIFAISGNKLFYKIGDSFATAQWFTASENAQSIAKTLSKGDEVEIKAEKNTSGNDTLLFIKKIGGGEDTSNKTSGTGQSKSTYGKSPEEQNNIKRLALGNMVSRSLIALQGHIDLNNITSIIDTLYAKYEEKIG